MAKEVDTKVIEMQFDNADFEKGVKETRQSINGLKESISNLSDSANGTESIEKVNRVVVDKMNVLATAVDQTVRRITDGVINSVNQITHKFNELTIAPVSQGFGKYEEQIASVQVIMNATGDSIETVQKQLDKLMWYTDETSYSYADMANNIGKFTSANVPLEDAVTAMMGIANWAGVSGANVQQASRAMYNLSQAMGTGTLKLQDWMSIENANMATTEFKKNLIETAKELGTLSKDTKVTAENMRESLKDGWVTADVLTATLKKYGNYTEDLYKIQKASGGEIDSATSAMDAYGEIYANLVDTLGETVEKFGENSEEFKKLLAENNLSVQTAADLMEIKRIRDYNAELVNTEKALKAVADKYGIESEQFRKEAEKTGLSVKDAARMVDEGIDSFKKVEQSLGEKALRASQEAKTFTDAWSATIDGVSSAWLRFWQAVWGNYEEAKEFWTWLANEPLYETFSATAGEIAKVMENASALGARANIVEGFKRAWEHVRNAISLVKEVFGEIFPFFADLDNASITIYGLTEKFKMWANMLQFTDENMKKASDGMLAWQLRVDRFKDGVHNTLIILKSLAIIAGNIIWNIGRIVTELLPRKGAITDFLTQLLGDAAQVDKAVSGMTNKITFVANVIIAIIRTIKYTIDVYGSSILKAVLKMLVGIVMVIVNFFKSDFVKIALNVASSIGLVIFSIAESIIHTFSFLFSAIVNLVSAIIGVIMQFAQAEDKIKWIKDWFVQLWEFAEPLRIIFESVYKTFEVIIRVSGHVVNAIAEFVSNIDIWRAALILIVIQMINSGLGIGWLLGKIFGAFKTVFDLLTTTFNPLKFIINKFLSGIQEAVEGLFSIIDVAKLRALGVLIMQYALSIMVLAGAAVILSTIDPNVFKQALGGVLALMAILAAFMIACNKILNNKTIKSFKELLGPDGQIKETIESITQTLSLGTQLLSIAAVIGSLAALMTVLGNVYNAVGSTTAFFTILAGVGILLAGIFFALLMFQKSMAKATEKTDNTISIKMNAVGGSINHLAIGLISIAASLALLNFIDPDQMKDSAIIMGIAAAAFLAFSVIIAEVAKKISKYDEQNNTNAINYIDTFGKSIDGLAKALRNMALGMFVIGKIPADRLEKAKESMVVLSIALIGVMTVFTILIERITEVYSKNTGGAINNFKQEFRWAFGASTQSNTYKEGVGGNDLIKAAFAVQILCNSMMGIALAIVPLSFFEFDKVATATVALITLMGLVAVILGAFTEGLKNQNDNKVKISSKDIFKIAASISLTAFAIDLITAAILPLAGMILASRLLMKDEDISPVGRAVGAIAEIITAVAGYNVMLITALGVYNKKVPVMLEDDTIIALSKNIIKMAEAVDLIALAVAGLATLRWVTGSDLTPAIGAITIVMGAMAVFMDAVLAGVALVANKANVDPDSIMKNLGSLVILMATSVDMISAAVGILSVLALIPGTQLITAGNVITSIIAIMGLVESLILYAISLQKADTSDIIKESRNSFLALAGAIDLVAVGIAGIIVAIGAMHIDTNAVVAVMKGIAVIFAEMAFYMGFLVSRNDDYIDMSHKLYAIALSTDLMAAAVGIIALSLGTLLSYGEDTFAGIGIFTTLITIIGVYNAIMLEVAKSMPDEGGTQTLLAIAADFLLMAAAIAIIAPAVGDLTRLQKEFGDLTMTAAILQGIVEPMIALIAGVSAILFVAKNLGSGGKWGDILALSILIAALSAGMLLLANAAKVLSSIDTKALSDISTTITTLMWTFVGSVAVIAVISNVAGEKVKDLALAFMYFVAALVIGIWALNSVRKALKEISEDETLQNIFSQFAEWVKEEPAEAALATAGTIAGGIFIMSMLDKIKSGFFDGFDDIFKDIGKNVSGFLFKGIPSEIGHTLASNAFAGYGGSLTRMFGNLSVAADNTVTLTDGLMFGLGKGMELSPLMVGWISLGTIFGGAIAASIWGGLISDLIDYAATGDAEVFDGLEKFGYDMGVSISKGIKNSPVLSTLSTLVTPTWLKAFSGEVLENQALEIDLSNFEDEEFWGPEKLQRAAKKLSDAIQKEFNKTGKMPNLADHPFMFGGYFTTDLQNPKKQISKLYKEIVKQYQETYGGVRTYEEVQNKERIEREKEVALEADKSLHRIGEDSKTIGDILDKVYAKEHRMLNWTDAQKEMLARGTHLEAVNMQEVEEAYNRAYDSINNKYIEISKERTKYAYDSYIKEQQYMTSTAEYKQLLDYQTNEKEMAMYAARDAEEKKRIDAGNQALSERRGIYVTTGDYAEQVRKSEGGTLGFLLRQVDTVEATSDAREDVEDAAQGVLSVEEAVSSQYAEQNRLLGKQFSLTKAISDISKNDWSGVTSVLKNVTTKTSIKDTILGFVNDWKSGKSKELFNSLSGGGTFFNLENAKKALDAITGGKSFDVIKGRLKELLGFESEGTLLDIFNLFGGGTLNFGAITSFDINDIEGSIKKIFNVGTEEGNSLFNDIFNISGEDFNMDLFLNKILDQDQWEELKKQLSGYGGEALDFTNQVDWSNVGNAADLAGYNAGTAFSDSFSDTLNYNDLLNPTSALNSAETQQAIDAFAEAGDLAADAFRSSIEAQEDELKKTAEAMGESFALAFNAAEEATANPPLEKQNAEAINSTVENFEEAKMYANAYKRQLDTDKAALDKAKAKLTQAEKDAEKKKNADGSADVTSQKNLEKAKKEYEEAEAQYNATKSQYDSFVAQAKGFKEEYLKAQEKKDFQKNTESLEEAIENNKREYALMEEALKTGDYSKLPDYIKNIGDLVEAMKASKEELAELEGYQEEVAAQNKDEEISGDIAPKYTEFDKTRVNASRKALREENEKLAQEYKENESLIAYYEKQNDDYSKKELERLKERNKAIEDKKESNRNLYNSSSAKGYKELVGNREQTQYEINAIEEALKNYKSTGKIILPKSVMEKYSGTKNWGELLQTLYVRLAKYDNDIRAVANIGLENAEDRPEQPDYISLAEQVGNLTSNFEDLFLASEMFTQALNEARTAVGDRLTELDREYTLNMGILKGLEGRTDEASVKRRNELEARQKEIDKERADISKNYNMLSAEDLKQKRAESEKLDKQISGYEALLRMSDTEFAKKSGGRDRSQIVDLYDKARVDKAVVDKELGVLSNVMTKGVESGESIETQTANLDINTQALALNVGGVDLSNAGDILSNVPITQADQEKWLSESSGYTPVNTGDLSKQVEDASKQDTDNINAQLADYSSTLAMSSRNIAQQANKEVEDVKQSNDILGGLITSTNEKLDNLMTKVNNIYTNGVNYLAAITEIQNGMEDIANSGVYLDSKTLIGRIAPGLDRQLGGFAFRRA